MMRPNLTSVKKLSWLQKRFIKFDRHVDDDGQVFYTRAKRHVPLRRETHDFFMLSDLVLDLDAIDAPHVRVFDEHDEQRLREAWAVTPKQEAVNARLKQFQEQLQQSRTAASRMSRQPMSCWRITDYDLLSAAIRGAPLSSPRDRLPQSAADVEEECLLEQIRVENGIPLHAVEQDEHFLRWMLLRQKVLQQSIQSNGQDALPTGELVKALRQQKSITAIRRLVTRYLTTSTDPSSFGNVSISQAVRYECERVMTQCPENQALVLDVLIFIANLTERIAASNGHVCPFLCGYALVLSARSGAFEAVSEWLRRGHSRNIWAGAESSKDVLSALTWLRSIMDSTAETALNSTASRQLVFQIVTGIDEGNQVLLDSFRAIVVAYLKDDCTLIWQEALAVYEAYVLLLGHLGAGRMLWKEWRTSAILAQERMDSVNSQVDRMTCLFQRALKHSVDVMASTDDEERPGLGLDECATLDYHAIEMQNITTKRCATSDALQLTEVKTTLDMPLVQCLQKLKALQTRTA